MSGYSEWDQKEHADKWLLFPENLGEYLSIDETSLSNVELYTILTNKAAKGKKGSIVAIIEGVNSNNIISYLKKLPKKLRYKVKEITLDFANSMNKICRSCFPNASLVVDRFHVQKLACDAVQEIRIRHRWEAIAEENEKIKEFKLEKEKAKSSGIKISSKKYEPEEFENGDTKKQLLARSRYLLFKSRDKWNEKQKERAKILFENFPDIEQAYNISEKLRSIFSLKKIKDVVRAKLALWHNQVEDSGFDSFKTIANTIESHYEEVLNYFNNRNTNAGAESFNAKIKALRADFRGVSDINFFLFRLIKIFA